jgi:glycosyltransferase involved in cell wall biosynthesis
MPTPKISVLMPVHQCESYVADACNSILNQSFSDFEFIVLNDGSSDRSAEILETIAQRDKRVMLIQRENRGLIKTRNELMAVARAPLIAWMDSDDLSHPDRLLDNSTAFSSTRIWFASEAMFWKSTPRGCRSDLTASQRPTSRSWKG